MYSPGAQVCGGRPELGAGGLLGGVVAVARWDEQNSPDVLLMGHSAERGAMPAKGAWALSS